MPSATDLLASIQKSAAPVKLSDLLALHPDVPRRTAQRWVSKLIYEGRVAATGQGRARRYRSADVFPADSAAKSEDVFPSWIPVSPDSRDILNYLNRPVTSRNPVGYQSDFIESYQPNNTWYLSEPLRHQLQKMGETGSKQYARPHQ